MILLQVYLVNNKNKLSISGAYVQKYSKYETARKETFNIKITSKILFANLHFKVRGQKAYYDGHPNIMQTCLQLYTGHNFYKKNNSDLYNGLNGAIYLKINIW